MNPIMFQFYFILSSDICITAGMCLKFLVLAFIHISVCMSHICKFLWRLELDPLELELQMVMSKPTKVLGTELMVSGRTASCS